MVGGSVCRPNLMVPSADDPWPLLSLVARPCVRSYGEPCKEQNCRDNGGTSTDGKGQRIRRAIAPATRRWHADARTSRAGGDEMTGTWPEGSPTVLRMILARQLQVLRETAGMSYEQAAR